MNKRRKKEAGAGQAGGQVNEMQYKKEKKNCPRRRFVHVHLCLLYSHPRRQGGNKRTRSINASYPTDHPLLDESNFHLPWGAPSVLPTETKTPSSSLPPLFDPAARTTTRRHDRVCVFYVWTEQSRPDQLCRDLIPQTIPAEKLTWTPRGFLQFQGIDLTLLPRSGHVITWVLICHRATDSLVKCLLIARTLLGRRLLRFEAPLSWMQRRPMGCH